MRRFVCYFWFNGFDHISFGFHFCFRQPNIELHVPFGFLRVGWEWESVLYANLKDTGFWRGMRDIEYKK